MSAEDNDQESNENDEKEEKERRLQDALAEIDKRVKEMLKSNKTDFERCPICGKLIDGGICFCNDVFDSK
ncbi:MAG TPA: hypothetical protein VK211_29375 [Kamptonema sp.]|nr:hypothetical protein [Kamptonema sp.]